MIEQLKRVANNDLEEYMVRVKMDDGLYIWINEAMLHKLRPRIK